MLNEKEFNERALYPALEIIEDFGFSIVMANLKDLHRLSVNDLLTPQKHAGKIADSARSARGYQEAFLATLHLKATRKEIPAFATTIIQPFQNPFAYVSGNKGEMIHYKKSDLHSALMSGLEDMFNSNKKLGNNVSETMLDELRATVSSAFESACQKIMPVLLETLVVCNGFRQGRNPSEPRP